MAVEKRIPNGAKVRWQSRYLSDPMHEGAVQMFHSKVDYWPSDWYEVVVAKNKPTRRVLTPNAANLEAQNPTKLKRVK